MDGVSNVDSVDADIALLMQQADAVAKAKPKPKGKAKARAGCGEEEEIASSKDSKASKKRAGGKTFQVCKGCGERIPIADCAPNFAGDWKCKRALDNIARLATKQGPESVAFVKSQREDPEKCKVSSYMEACPETMDNAKGVKRGQWCLTRYEERTTAASALIRDKVGEMMGRKLYIEHAKTARGGKKSEEQAKAQWSRNGRAGLLRRTPSSCATTMVRTGLNGCGFTPAMRFASAAPG